MSSNGQSRMEMRATRQARRHQRLKLAVIVSSVFALVAIAGAVWIGVSKSANRQSAADVGTQVAGKLSQSFTVPLTHTASDAKECQRPPQPNRLPGSLAITGVGSPVQWSNSSHVRQSVLSNANLLSVTPNVSRSGYGTVYNWIVNPRESIKVAIASYAVWMRGHCVIKTMQVGQSSLTYPAINTHGVRSYPHCQSVAFMVPAGGKLAWALVVLNPAKPLWHAPAPKPVKSPPVQVVAHVG